MKEIIEKYGRNESLSSAETDCMNGFIQGEKAHLQQLRKSHQRLQIVQRTFAIVASLLLFGLVCNFPFPPTMPKYEHERLAMAHLVPHGARKMADLVPYSAQKKGENTFADAKNAYQDEAFDTAALLFQKVIESGKADETAYFLGAISYLYQKEPAWKKAKTLLLHLQNHGDGYELDQVLWYISLIYIQAGELNAAQATLDELIKRGFFNLEKAKQLSASLKKIEKK
ncbi:MAG: hypothetical protein RL329_2765 [Bacteroidota bacterium]|jgi:tetratricopeptide (TPR) repeat protein